MIKRFIAFAAALTAAFTAAGCGSGSGSSSDTPAETTAASTEAVLTRPSDIGLFTSEGRFDQDYAGVPDAEEGPLLKISNTTAKAGDIANVTVSVSNAEGKWDACGLHIVYPEVLECIMNEDTENEPEYEVGDALKKAAATVAVKWRKNFPEDLKKENKGSLFFTAICPENEGRDGDIVTFSFRVPEDAAAGTVYEVYFYYSSNDRTKDTFSGTDGGLSFEKYAFTHWTGGSVTVE